MGYRINLWLVIRSDPVLKAIFGKDLKKVCRYYIESLLRVLRSRSLWNGMQGFWLMLGFGHIFPDAKKSHFIFILQNFLLWFQKFQMLQGIKNIQFNSSWPPLILYQSGRQVPYIWAPCSSLVLRQYNPWWCKVLTWWSQSFWLQSDHFSGFGVS